jgi:hypothetical protein
LRFGWRGESLDIVIVIAILLAVVAECTGRIISQCWEVEQQMHMDGLLASVGMSRQALSISLDQFYNISSQSQRQPEGEDVAIMENTLANLCLMVDACTLSGIHMAIAAAAAASTNASTPKKKRKQMCVE